jgi:outer membrane protein assembly factor BamB/energy-coupling factor transporter ATP-binding protein EcfA2
MQETKQNTAFKKSDKRTINPFPGLRPFTTDESHLFFGREGQSEEVLEKLADNKFVAVLGASGSGKSSLMFCGIIPILHGGFIAKAGTDWEIVKTRPGNNPVWNLALNMASVYAPEEKNNRTAKLIYSILKRSSNGISEVYKIFGRTKNILILLDQFEELFRFNKTSDYNANETLAYVKLILNAVKQEDHPLYFVMTMRSDFIGDCSQYQELTSLINNSHYLIPQMTRDDLAQAIQGPIAVAGGNISKRLLHRLLNEVGEKNDQLPILQHALMRSWDNWEKLTSTKEAIDIAHYESIGTMEFALSIHANEAFDELGTDDKMFCEKLFKSLTEKGDDNRGIRRPSSFKEISGILNTNNKKIIEISNIFQTGGRTFLNFSDDNLNGDTILDISHESLMRIWDKLILWVEEETNSVEVYLKLCDSSLLYQKGEIGLLKPPDLQLAVNWRDKNNPTKPWAIRNNSAFERAIVYLDSSEEEYLEEEKNKVRLQKKTLRRTRLFALVVGLAALFAMGMMIWSFTLKVEADKQRTAAKENELKAEESAQQAKVEAQKAKDALKLAEIKTQEAEKSAEDARLAAIEAEKQTKIAETQAGIARSNLSRAIEQEKLAIANAKQADENAKKADNQKNLAEKSKERADKLRMLSIAQAMAVKSQQPNKDIDQKGLLAFQAYQYVDEYNGEEHHGDVYAGLYSTLTAIKTKGYNSLQAHKGGIRDLVLDPTSNELITLGSDRSMKKWDNGMNVQSSQKFIFTDGSENSVITPTKILQVNDYIIASGNNGKIVVIDPNGDSKSLRKTDSRIWDMVAYNDALFVVHANSTMEMWNINTGEHIKSLELLSELKTIDYSPATNMVVGGSGVGELMSIDIGNEFRQNSVGYTGVGISKVLFTSDGKFLVSGDMEGHIVVYDAKTGEKTVELTGHTARVSDLELSANDEFLATASFDGTVRLFQLEKLDLVEPIVLRDIDDWVWSLAFSSDGEELYCGSAAGKISRYPTRTKTLAKDLCDQIKRNMTEKEWNRFVAKDIPYRKTCENIE